MIFLCPEASEFIVILKEAIEIAILSVDFFFFMALMGHKMAGAAPSPLASGWALPGTASGEAPC